MGTIGDGLREARNRWGLTLRQVEERSALLAKQWENRAYRISASWLDRVEREDRKLSATKLLVLAAIYGLTAEQMLALCSSPKANSNYHLERVSDPNVTLLLEAGPLEEHAKYWLPDRLVTDAAPQKTDLIETAGGLLASHYRRAIIGRRDRTLEPMIQAGSIVLIDTQKRTIVHRREWTNDFDRPVYFLFTRNGYAAGFCELDKEAEWLTIVPHALSQETNQRWRYKREIEVIGTVTGVFSRRAS